MSVSPHASLPAIALPHKLQDDLEKVQLAMMERKRREFHTTEEWVASGNAALLKDYAEEHPDELVTFSKEGLEKLGQEAHIR